MANILTELASTDFISRITSALANPGAPVRALASAHRDGPRRAALARRWGAKQSRGRILDPARLASLNESARLDVAWTLVLSLHHGISSPGRESAPEPKDKPKDKSKPAPDDATHSRLRDYLSEANHRAILAGVDATLAFEMLRTVEQSEADRTAPDGPIRTFRGLLVAAMSVARRLAEGVQEAGRAIPPPRETQAAPEALGAAGEWHQAEAFEMWEELQRLSPMLSAAAPAAFALIRRHGLKEPGWESAANGTLQELQRCLDESIDSPWGYVSLERWWRVCMSIQRLKDEVWAIPGEAIGTADKTARDRASSAEETMETRLKLRRPIPVCKVAGKLNTRSDNLLTSLRRAKGIIDEDVSPICAELDDILRVVGRHRRAIRDWADEQYPPITQIADPDTAPT